MGDFTGKKSKRKQTAAMNEMNAMIQGQVDEAAGFRETAQQVADQSRADYANFQFTNPYADARNVYAGAQNAYARRSLFRGGGSSAYACKLATKKKGRTYSLERQFVSRRAIGTVRARISQSIRGRNLLHQVRQVQSNHKHRHQRHSTKCIRKQAGV